MLNQLHFLKPKCSRQFHYVVASVFLVVIISKQAEAQSQRPNIILILGDDIGYKTLTCNGGKRYSTLHLDSLAAQGMRFTECHASPLCSPSRFMLLTGKYNFRNYTHWGQMDTGQRTIANMMRNAGYQTACYGKWQLDGGDTSVRGLGFDRYCLSEPFAFETGFRYKNPRLYANGANLSDTQTLNKYSEDIVVDSILNFIDQNQSTPFFIYYPMILAHYPFSPTPDDSAFATWSDSNIINNVSDTSFYPSMIKYMDKKIGEIVAKLRELGIENNTLIIYTGDNGASDKISTDPDDSLSAGQKGNINELGTHVPLIAYWPGTITPGLVNDDLIDFTDFLPTIADLTSTTRPTTFGPLDGVSFFPGLLGQTGTPRDWSFCHYDPHPPNNKYRRWAQNATYKLYDTSFYSSARLFYNIADDPKEMHPIADSLLTSDQSTVKQQFLDVINSYRAQGIPLLSATDVSAISDSAALVTAFIDINGGSTISNSGIVWSTSPNPQLGSGNQTNGNIEIGSFNNYVIGLTPNTTFFVRPYATNLVGNTGYGNEKMFTTVLHAPHAIDAKSKDTTSFVARWNNTPGAASYRLDVSGQPAFATFTAVSMTEGFDAGATAKGWKFSSKIGTSTTKFGTASPSLVFKSTGQQVTTISLAGPATSLSFWLRGSVANAGSLLLEGYNGVVWRLIDSISNIPYHNGIILTYNAASAKPLPINLTQFRFTYIKITKTLYFDDVSINYNKSTPSYVAGNHNVTVNDTSKLITGLRNKNYYYRVRAVNDNGTSGNSNVITTKPCNPPLIINISATNLSCSGDNTAMIQLNATGVAPLVYTWTGPNGFSSTSEDISNLSAGTYQVIVTSNEGCSTDSSIAITEPPALSVSISKDPIPCNGGTATLRATATGGTGSYHYTLSDGTNTTGPQDSNQFIVPSGIYTVTVADDNGCVFTTDTLHIDEPEALTATASADAITCIGGTTTLTVTAQGGTGSHHYTLADASNNTTGPQDDNHFIVSAGAYTATITDDNGCSFTTDTVQVDDGAPCGAIASVQNNKTNDVKTVEERVLRIFPNPSSRTFTLDAGNTTKENVEVIVTDVFGRKVFEARSSRNGKYSFGAEFGQGTYFVQVIQGEKVRTLKIIKEN